MSKPKSGTMAAAPQGEQMGRELSDAIIFFHEAVAAHLGMTAAEWKCLGLLREHGALPASRLAELSGFTSGAITGIVDRLERAGYALRAPHPTDRRSVIVHPGKLKEMQQRVGPVFQSLLSAMARIAGHYTAAELEAIAGFFRETTEVLRTETTKLRKRKAENSGV
ncbi:MAG TPA: MarR family transcriptional regulator [Pseudacidobacterium sp.]|nr:MarR family transcriptional regulator [Pseudacidobacterium sp.]